MREWARGGEERRGEASRSNPRTSAPCAKYDFQLGLGSDENEYVMDGVSQRTPG